MIEEGVEEVKKAGFCDRIDKMHGTTLTTLNLSIARLENKVKSITMRDLAPDNESKPDSSARESKGYANTELGEKIESLDHETMFLVAKLDAVIEKIVL